MKFNVCNVEVFLTFLRSVLRVAPSTTGGAKFEVDEKGTYVGIINESKTIRAFFNTNSMCCEEKTDFSFQDLSKLYKSFLLIKNIGITSADIIFTGSFLTFSKKGCNFKLKVVKPDIVERYISNAISIKLTPIYEFETSEEKVKNLIQCSHIINDTESKVYFISNNNGMVGQIDDKTNVMSDSIGIPLSDKVTGSVNKVVCTTLENFKLFSVLPTDKIKVKLTDKNVFEVISKFNNEENTCSVNMYLICSILKG